MADDVPVLIFCNESIFTVAGVTGVEEFLLLLPTPMAIAAAPAAVAPLMRSVLLLRPELFAVMPEAPFAVAGATADVAAVAAGAEAEVDVAAVFAESSLGAANVVETGAATLLALMLFSWLMVSRAPSDIISVDVACAAA